MNENLDTADCAMNNTAEDYSTYELSSLARQLFVSNAGALCAADCFELASEFLAEERTRLDAIYARQTAARRAELCKGGVALCMTDADREGVLGQVGLGVTVGTDAAGRMIGAINLGQIGS